MRLVTHWKHARALPSGRLFHASVEDEHGLLRCNRLESPMSELGQKRRLPHHNLVVRSTSVSGPFGGGVDGLLSKSGNPGGLSDV